MDLILNNKINKDNTVNKQVEDFMKELQNSLTKENYRTETLKNEILAESDLAIKYEDRLSSIVEKYMKELSYDCNFVYFDYDQKANSYFFDIYSEGDVTREYLSSEEAKEMQYSKGTFWRIWNEDNIIESDDLKDNIKFNTEYDLQSLESRRK